MYYNITDLEQPYHFGLDVDTTSPLWIFLLLTTVKHLDVGGQSLEVVVVGDLYVLRQPTIRDAG